MLPRLSSLVLTAALISLAQQPAAPQPPQPAQPAADTGVFRIPSRFPDDPPPARPAEPEKPQPLRYTGKPIALPVQCTDDDIQRFGMTCTDRDPCPVYLDLSGLQPLGQKIFLAGNLHNGSSTMYSVLLASEDLGASWTEPQARIPAAILEQIQFIDFQSGWISGQLMQPMARDPFFLLTTDAGRTWRRRPVFSDPRTGAIEQYHFDSATTGTMIVDRTQSGDEAAWERYESQTGGESWTLREVSSRALSLPVRKRLTGNADWRIRAEGTAHRVERRQNGQWTTVAAFVVKVGLCKPSLDELPPPQAPPEAAPAEPPPAPRRPTGSPSLKKKK